MQVVLDVVRIYWFLLPLMSLEFVNFYKLNVTNVHTHKCVEVITYVPESSREKNRNMLIMSRSTNKNITQSKRETAMIQPVLLHNVEKVSEST